LNEHNPGVTAELFLAYISPIHYNAIAPADSTVAKEDDGNADGGAAASGDGESPAKAGTQLAS